VPRRSGQFIIGSLISPGWEESSAFPASHCSTRGQCVGVALRTAGRSSPSPNPRPSDHSPRSRRLRGKRGNNSSWMLAAIDLSFRSAPSRDDRYATARSSVRYLLWSRLRTVAWTWRQGNVCPQFIGSGIAQAHDSGREGRDIHGPTRRFRWPTERPRREGDGQLICRTRKVIAVVQCQTGR
jgi:hypothetical protein